ncbi:hypothetical protein C453_16113 [Haloferax elongans ATCC BAA-1513]|uniref:N-acetyltransferase domain-containing protein n=1 Tax=Haloferax elongans ATCC BAA-1513 TaxID=1230453 RepID=M0HDL9_HALEO|nr:GNAT family N-acetyltransferase [Haloferax elongans]ELZ82626.1 hypothetical protein C453_16113 [Haloferax elongans ATCC BAA-1513]
MHLRPLPEEHLETYDEFLYYSFRAEDGPDWDDENPPDPDIYNPRGFYDAPPDIAEEDLSASDLVTVCAFYDFTARVRGEWHPLPGISAVASPPETRRQGHVSAMLDELLVEFRESGRYLSALWPFEYEFYRRLGWERTNNYAKTTVPVDELDAVAPRASGQFVRFETDDWARLDRVYAEASPEDLALDRTEGWWRHRVFRGWQKDPYVYGWERDGDLRGYLIYRIDGSSGDRTMKIEELAAVDAEARGHLLRFVRDHDSQIATVTIRREHESTRLIDDLTDPRAATVEIQPGPMVRIVDVEAALEAVSLPSDAAGEFVLDVSDDHCPWNDGTFHVVVADGEARVESVEITTNSHTDADATTDIGALSQLLVGARSVDELVRTDSLSVRDDATRDVLTATFTERDCYLREFF